MTRVTELESSNLTLNQKMSDLTQNLEDTNSAHRAQLAAKDNEIKRLLDELSRQLEEYQNLMDTKIGLDMEIAVFRRLLESEEDRLGISIDEGGKFHNSLILTHICKHLKFQMISMLGKLLLTVLQRL